MHTNYTMMNLVLDCQHRKKTESCSLNLPRRSCLHLLRLSFPHLLCLSWPHLLNLRVPNLNKNIPIMLWNGKMSLRGRQYLCSIVPFKPGHSDAAKVNCNTGLVSSHSDHIQSF